MKWLSPRFSQWVVQFFTLDRHTSPNIPYPPFSLYNFPFYFRSDSDEKKGVFSIFRLSDVHFGLQVSIDLSFVGGVNIFGRFFFFIG